MSRVAIVWPCPLAVDAYAAAGRDLGFPRPHCPSCAGPLVFWSGYRRYVREAGRYWKIFVPRLAREDLILPRLAAPAIRRAVADRDRRHRKQGSAQVTVPAQAADLIDRLRAAGFTLTYAPVPCAPR